MSSLDSDNANQQWFLQQEELLELEIEAHYVESSAPRKHGSSVVGRQYIEQDHFAFDKIRITLLRTQYVDRRSCEGYIR